MAKKRQSNNVKIMKERMAIIIIMENNVDNNNEKYQAKEIMVK